MSFVSPETVQVNGDADASTVQLFPATRVPALLYVRTVNESAAPTEPEIRAPATVTATVVFPALTVETVGAPGARTRHWA